jgi:hypothetical protein
VRLGMHRSECVGHPVHICTATRMLLKHGSSQGCHLSFAAPMPDAAHGSHHGSVSYTRSFQFQRRASDTDYEYRGVWTVNVVSSFRTCACTSKNLKKNTILGAPFFSYRIENSDKRTSYNSTV